MSLEFKEEGQATEVNLEVVNMEAGLKAKAWRRSGPQVRSEPWGVPTSREQGEKEQEGKTVKE